MFSCQRNVPTSPGERGGIEANGNYALPIKSLWVLETTVVDVRGFWRKLRRPILYPVVKESDFICLQSPMFK